MEQRKCHLHLVTNKTGKQHTFLSTLEVQVCADMNSNISTFCISTFTFLPYSVPGRNEIAKQEYWNMCVIKKPHNGPLKFAASPVSSTCSAFNGQKEGTSMTRGEGTRAITEALTFYCETWKAYGQRPHERQMAEMQAAN